MPAYDGIYENIRYMFHENGFLSCGFLSIDTDMIKLLDSYGIDPDLFSKFEYKNKLIAAAGFPLPLPDNNDISIDSGRIAPFASCNFYREAAERLRKIRKELSIHIGTNQKQIRIFCNSDLPEKLFGTLSGIGRIGKNGLLINDKAGSNFIIAGLIIPGISFPGTVYPEKPGTVCGSCSLCVRSCPTGALSGDGTLNRSLCIQELSPVNIKLSPVMMGKFKNRIYGCQECQICCPLNRNKIHGEYIERGRIGQSISLERFLNAGLSDSGLRDFFKGTVLSASWMDRNAFLRNAIIAAANNNNSKLIGLIEKYTFHENSVISSTAEFSLLKLKSRLKE